MGNDDQDLGSPRLHPILILGVGVIGLYAISKAFNLLTMQNNPGVSRSEARRIGSMLGIDWRTSPFGVDQFRRGIEVEMEHGPGGPAGSRADVTHGDMMTTAKIALAHLAEFPDYYIRLDLMEARAEAGVPPCSSCR
jgi:hypothetical protein